MGNGNTRRRGAALEQAILRAAVAELREHGYPGLNMDKVAQRAGTNKNAIYRRWPSRAALGVAAYRELVHEELRLPDTGDLRGDVLAVLRKINHDVSTPRAEIVRGLLAAAADEPDLLALLNDQVDDGASAIWLSIVERAVARGEVSGRALRPRIVTVAMSLLRSEFIVHGLGTVPDEVLVEIVDEIYLPLLRGR